MKILRIVSSGYEQGGAENALIHSNEYLRSSGHKVITISSNARGDLKHFSDYEFAEIPKRGLSKLMRTTFNLPAYRLAKKVASEFRPDIVTLHTLGQPSPSVLFALKGYRMVLCIHGPEGYTKSLMPWVLGAHDYKNESFNIKELNLLGLVHYLYFTYIYRPIFLLGLRHVGDALSYSHYTQRIMGTEGINSEYIPEGVELFKFSPKAHTAKILGIAGRLEKHKGIDLLIRAMSIIRITLPDVKLFIAGEGSYKPALVDLVNTLSLRDNVVFLGQLSRNQIQEFYESIDVLVMLSGPAETFGKVGVEAMSVGRTVIAPRIGGISDWLIDGVNGFFIEKDETSIANKVITLLNDRDLLIALGRAARKTAEKFSMELYAKKHEDYFSKILSKGPQSL